MQSFADNLPTTQLHFVHAARRALTNPIAQAVYQSGNRLEYAKYGSDPVYTASIPTGVVNSSIGSRNLQISLRYRF